MAHACIGVDLLDGGDLQSASPVVFVVVETQPLCGAF